MIEYCVFDIITSNPYNSIRKYIKSDFIYCCIACHDGCHIRDDYNSVSSTKELNV
jgi:hypothetical protein